MATRNRSVTTAVPGAPAKMQPRKGKDGFVADNVFAISGVVPDDVRAGVDSFETLDSKSFRRCLQIASRVASGDAIDGRLLTETGASEEATRTAVTALVSIIAAIYRSDATLDEVEYDLALLKCSEACRKDIVALVNSTRESFVAKINMSKVAQPRLSGVRWRISVCISSAACSRILRPFVLLEITLSNGRIRTLEMSVDKFNELRFSVAQALKAMHSLGTNPLFKLMEASKQRSLAASK